MRAALRTLVSLILVPIVGASIGIGIGAVISGTWFARAVMQPAGFTVSSAGAGTTEELLEPEEPKEASPPTAVVESPPPPPPVLAPEDIVVSTPAPEPKPAVTAPVAVTASSSPKDDPEAEVPGSCLILQERYCRSGVRLTAPNGKYGGVGFLLPPGTPVFAPAEGIVNTSGVLTLPSGAKYHTVFFNAPTGYQLVLVGNPLRNGKTGLVARSSVMVRVTDSQLIEMGRYNLVVTSFPDGKKYDEEFLLPAGK